jgi:Spy/CpxP family protein refolding chaperone
MDALLSFRATLTPEQRAQFDEGMNKRQSHGSKGRSKSGPGNDQGQLREER